MNKIRLLAVAFALTPGLAAAQHQIMELGVEPETPAIPMLLAELAPVPAPELAEQRGGFIGPDRLRIDIGFDSVVMVDRILQARTHLSIADLAAVALSPDRISGLNDSLVLPLNQIIQNDLNQKTIQSIQILNIELSNLGSLNSGPLKQVLQQQLLQALH